MQIITQVTFIKGGGHKKKARKGERKFMGPFMSTWTWSSHLLHNELILKISVSFGLIQVNFQIFLLLILPVWRSWKLQKYYSMNCFKANRSILIFCELFNSILGTILTYFWAYNCIFWDHIRTIFILKKNVYQNNPFLS